MRGFTNHDSSSINGHSGADSYAITSNDGGLVVRIILIERVYQRDIINIGHVAVSHNMIAFITDAYAQGYNVSYCTIDHISCNVFQTTYERISKHIMHIPIFIVGDISQYITPLI